MSNLRNISKNLKALLAQSKEISTDWNQGKKVHSGNYGYLNLAINYPEIWNEVELIKNLVKQFNVSRYNMWKYIVMTQAHREDLSAIPLVKSVISGS